MRPRTASKIALATGMTIVLTFPVTVFSGGRSPTVQEPTVARLSAGQVHDRFADDERGRTRGSAGAKPSRSSGPHVADVGPTGQRVGE